MGWHGPVGAQTQAKIKSSPKPVTRAPARVALHAGVGHASEASLLTEQ